ncbi:MAG: S4 domain-containing protein YaaA [Bacilli bacterium]|nr:S4 domain-containing protein YaaA [Bacilli bacterium]
MKKITINTDYITVGQFLKFAHIIQNGGEAKFFLECNQVIVDGEIDNRRGRKLYPGTKVNVLGNDYEISK